MVAKAGQVRAARARALRLRQAASAGVLLVACNQSTFKDCDSVVACVGPGVVAVAGDGHASAAGSGPVGGAYPVPAPGGSPSEPKAGGGDGGDAVGGSGAGADAGDNAGGAGAGTGSVDVVPPCEVESRHAGTPAFLEGWRYRRPVTVNNGNGIRYAYTILASAAFPACHVQPDLRDLRVTAGDGVTPVPFYVEHVRTSGATTSATIWIRPSSIAVGTTTEGLFLYTDNPDADSIADGRGTFEVFDSFEQYPVGRLAEGAGYATPTGGVLSWTSRGQVNVASGTAHQGGHSLQILDTGPGEIETAAAVSSSLSSRLRGVVSVWLRRGADQAGTGGAFDLYLSGDGIGSVALKVAAGLGANGKFHYWGGDQSAGFVDLQAAWSPDTWYLVTLYFNTVTDAFAAKFQDSDLTLLDYVENLPLANAASYVDRAILHAEGTHDENASYFADDLRMQQVQYPDPVTFVGDEQVP